MSARIDGSEIFNPGLLTDRITWQQKSVSGQNSSGEDIYTWTDLLTCWARVQSLGGREFERAMQKWPEADFQVKQYFNRRCLVTDLRIAWRTNGGITYLDVLNIDNPVGTENHQTVTCKNFGSTFTD